MPEGAGEPFGEGMPELPEGAGAPFEDWGPEPLGKAGQGLPEQESGNENTSEEAALTERKDFGGMRKEGFIPPEGGGMPGGDHPMGGSGGADLNYTDDELENYSVIWEGEVTDTGEADHKRVVTALKQIGEGTELESYLDVDNVLKYMAVHTFSVNMDSLSGNMAHNYYLYESGGRLNILPWDYNLAFGGMGGMGMGGDNGASGVINDAIDTPFQGTEFFDSLLENEEYLERYHAYLRQLVEEYVFGGRFEETYNRIRNQIDTLVETDPTAFYTYEEYEVGAEMLYQTVILRAQSVQGQLNGTIPSTDEGQRADSAGLVDASEIDVDVMGTFDRGERTERKKRD